MNEKIIEMKFRELPEELRREVLDYVEFLLKKYRGKAIKEGGFRFDWEGGLSDIGERLTSVELQHRALEWR